MEVTTKVTIKLPASVLGLAADATLEMTREQAEELHRKLGEALGLSRSLEPSGKGLRDYLRQIPQFPLKGGTLTTTEDKYESHMAVA